jgi:hypothetical protein
VNTQLANEWFLAREIPVAGFTTDPDWLATANPSLPSGGAVSRPVQRFSIPSRNGLTADGFSLVAVGVNAAGIPQAPGTLSLTVSVLELIGYQGRNNNSRQVHVVAADSYAAGLAVLAFTLTGNIVARAPGLGGAQNQYVLRATALTAPAAITLVRVFIKGLGSSLT